MNKNSLSELFDQSDNAILEANNDNNKIMIIDTSNIEYRTLYSAIFTNPEDNFSFNFWKHLFMNNILNIIRQFKPKKVIMAMDSRNSWRYGVYSEYKNKRKEAREKSVVNFDKFFPIFNDFSAQIKDVFSKIYMIQIDRVEADDIIAVMSKEVFKDEQVIIISSDGDMNQLITKNVKQYDPMKRKMVECLNPQKELDIKVLTGDKSDNIPPVKKKVGVVTAQKILTNGLDTFLNENAENKANYIRNKTLIDLNYIPQEIKTNIINTYNNYKLTDMESKKIVNFFVNNNLMKLLRSWESFADDIKGLE